MANNNITQRTAVEEARDELRETLESVGDGFTRESGNEYIFENYNITEGSFIRIDQNTFLNHIVVDHIHLEIKVINFKIIIDETDVNLSTITITDVSRVGDIEDGG